MLNDANSNAYRLNKSGEVIWQVQRDDSNHPSNWWEILHSNARNQGHIGAYEPFTYIWLKHQDGSLNTVANTGSPPEVAIWLEDSQILLAGSAYQQYILDPETGIAKNVTEGRPRPW